MLESISAEDSDAEDARSLGRMLHAAKSAFEAGGRDLFGRAADPEAHIEEVAEAYRALRNATEATPADMRLVLSLLTLSQNWLAALSTRHRNFDEFLAKSRAIIGGTCVGVGQTSLRIDSNSLWHHQFPAQVGF
jgi:hypothetical protein